MPMLVSKASGSVVRSHFHQKAMAGGAPLGVPAHTKSSKAEKLYGLRLTYGFRIWELPKIGDPNIAPQKVGSLL